jgi:hypothetical protein
VAVQLLARHQRIQSLHRLLKASPEHDMKLLARACGVAVARNLAKVEVVGSNPIRHSHQNYCGDGKFHVPLLVQS